MPWISVLMCESCIEYRPFSRGDFQEQVSRDARRAHWDQYDDLWYCPTCLRAVRSRLGADALVAGAPDSTRR